jgi:type II secretory pathway pseudopilin PulG
MESKRGWFLVKLLMLISVILAFIYLISPRLQKNIYELRDTTTQTNLYNIRAALLGYYKDYRKWPRDLNALVPKYLKKIPKEYLSSIRGSDKVFNARNENEFNSMRKPGAEGWIYGAYEDKGEEKFAHKVYPMSTTLSDKTGDTLSW